MSSVPTTLFQRLSYINHVRCKLQELIFKHNDMSVCRKQFLFCSRSEHSELESRIVRPLKLQAARLLGCVAIALRLGYKVGPQKVLRAVVVVDILRIDLEV